jgi:DNA-binding transcriptional regulator YdaS (Cro superfamily)
MIFMTAIVALAEKPGNEHSAKFFVARALRTVLYLAPMNITEFLNHSGMKQAELAKRLGTFESQVSRWVKGHQQVAWFHAVRLEEISGGLVTCDELRPDLSDLWTYLRNSRRKSEAA